MVRRHQYFCCASLKCPLRRFNGHIDGFVAGSERMAKSGATSAHTISPVEVSINGDKAVSESTGAILARFSHNSQDYDCLSYGRFVSRLVREDETWKLLSLEVIYDKDSLQPVTPSPAAADIAIDPKARQSYKCLDWVLAKHGFAIDRGLPGTDKSGSGEALMAACFSWLQSTDK